MTILIRCQTFSPAYRLNSLAERKPSLIDTQPMVQTPSRYFFFSSEIGLTLSEVFFDVFLY